MADIIIAQKPSMPSQDEMRQYLNTVRDHHGQKFIRDYFINAKPVSLTPEQAYGRLDFEIDDVENQIIMLTTITQDYDIYTVIDMDDHVIYKSNVCHAKQHRDFDPDLKCVELNQVPYQGKDQVQKIEPLVQGEVATAAFSLAMKIYGRTQEPVTPAEWKILKGYVDKKPSLLESVLNAIPTFPHGRF